MEGELAGRVATLMWRLRRVTTFEVAAAVHPPGPGPAPPPRFGDTDPKDLTHARRAVADIEGTLAVARRRQALVPALAAAGDADRVSPDDAVFLLTEAADAVQSARPFPPPTFDETGVRPPCDGPDGIDGTDPDFLTGLGVPAEFADEPAGWDGWTAGRVRAGFETLGAVTGWTAADLYRELLTADFPWLEGRLTAARAAADQAAAGGPTAIPSDAALAVLLRYEPHLSKQLSRTLDQLEKVRALRRR